MSDELKAAEDRLRAAERAVMASAVGNMDAEYDAWDRALRAYGEAWVRANQRKGELV